MVHLQVRFSCSLLTPGDTMLTLHLIGGVEASIDNVPVHGFRSQRTLGLFTYLGVNANVEFSRSHLAQLLWHDYAPQAAASSLRVSLCNLRQALTGYDGLVIGRRVVMLAGDIRYDLSSLAPMVARTSLMAGLDGIDSKPFQTWLRQIRMIFSPRLPNAIRDELTMDIPDALNRTPSQNADTVKTALLMFDSLCPGEIAPRALESLADLMMEAGRFTQALECFSLAQRIRQSHLFPKIAPDALESFLPPD